MISVMCFHRDRTGEYAAKKDAITSHLATWDAMRNVQEIDLAAWRLWLESLYHRGQQVTSHRLCGDSVLAQV